MGGSEHCNPSSAWPSLHVAHRFIYDDESARFKCINAYIFPYFKSQVSNWVQECIDRKNFSVIQGRPEHTSRAEGK